LWLIRSESFSGSTAVPFVDNTSLPFKNPRISSKQNVGPLFIPPLYGQIGGGFDFALGEPESLSHSLRRYVPAAAPTESHVAILVFELLSEQTPSSRRGEDIGESKMNGFGSRMERKTGNL
jgi:hypothetical protein